MKTQFTPWHLGCLLALVPATVLAQTTPASSPIEDASEVIELSPFQVDSSTDDGYASAFSTSGSRLRTNLKDVAASVSVLTNDFMDDLAANDIAAAMAFVAGAENDATTHQESISGLGSANGYVGGDFGDNNNRSGVIRVRGLGRASTTLNYFETIGSTDRYNTDRTEFLRGANSILFGLAEPAGLVNSSTKVARLHNRDVRIETKFDNFGSSRFILDINQPLIEDKLAIRAVGLYNDQRYEVDTAFQRDKRLFLTGTWQPFKNTTVRAFVEDSDVRGRRPNNRTVQDNVSEWLNAYNTYAPQMTQDQIDAAFFWDPNVRSSNGIAPDSVFTLTNGTTVDLGRIRRPLDTRNNGTVLIYNGNGAWQDPWDNIVTIDGNRRIVGSNPNPANTRSFFMRSGSNRENNPSFRADPQVTDKGIFPYDTVEIAALPGSYRDEQDQRLYASIDQKINDDFYLSFSFMHEDYEQEQNFAVLTQTNQISLDINKTTPDGRVNPNFLRPFVYGRNIAEYNEGTADAFQLQANYDLDFGEKTDGFGWLGRHRLTALYTGIENERFGYRWHHIWDNDIPGVFPAANINARSSARWIMQRWYVGDAVQLGDTSLRFTEFPDNVAAQWNRSYDYKYYDDANRVWKISPEPLSNSRQLVTGGRNWTIQENEGFGVSLQSFLLSDKLVTLFGWRTDSVDSFQGVPIGLNDVPFPQVPGVSRDEYLPDGAEFSDRADTTTQSVVYKFNDKIRVFANRSENFSATAPRQDNLYRNIAPASGETTDFGLGLSLLDNKLDIRASYFESSQDKATASTAVAGLRVPAFEDVLYNALENAGRLNEWFTIDPFGGTTTERYERPNNGATTEDRISEGYSIEISYRPNRNWDIIASFDQVDNVVTNVGSELGEFLAAREDYYGGYFAEGLRVDGTNDLVSSSDLVEDRFVSTVANNYINEIIGEGTSNLGIADYSAKLVGRYKFLEGPLNGLTVGANLRWESGKVLGYAEVPQLFNFGGLVDYPGRVSDVDNEHVGDSIVAGGLFVSYTTKLFNDRVRWRVQLNAQNIFNTETGLRVIAANADGSPVWARAQPQIFELSNSFMF